MQDFNFRNALIIGLLLTILTYIGYSFLNLSGKVDSNHNYLIQRIDYLMEESTAYMSMRV